MVKVQNFLSSNGLESPNLRLHQYVSLMFKYKVYFIAQMDLSHLCFGIVLASSVPSDFVTAGRGVWFQPFERL